MAALAAVTRGLNVVYIASAYNLAPWSHVFPRSISLLLFFYLMFVGVRARRVQGEAPVRPSSFGARVQPTAEAGAGKTLREMGVWHSEDEIAAHFTCRLVWNVALCAVAAGAGFQGEFHERKRKQPLFRLSCYRSFYQICLFFVFLLQFFLQFIHFPWHFACMCAP